MIYNVTDFKHAPLFVCELDGLTKETVEAMKTQMDEDDKRMMETYGKYVKDNHKENRMKHLRNTLLGIDAIKVAVENNRYDQVDVEDLIEEVIEDLNELSLHVSLVAPEK